MNFEQESRRSRISEWNWLCLSSLGLAVAAPFLPVVVYGSWAETHGMYVVLGPPAAWTIIVTVTIIRHGARGLWLLTGAPFALFWLYFRL